MRRPLSQRTYSGSAWTYSGALAGTLSTSKSRAAQNAEGAFSLRVLPDQIHSAERVGRNARATAARTPRQASARTSPEATTRQRATTIRRKRTSGTVPKGRAAQSPWTNRRRSCTARGERFPGSAELQLGPFLFRAPESAGLEPGAPRRGAQFT